MISNRDLRPGSFHLYDADVSWLMLACVLLVTFYSNFSCLLGLNQGKIKACCDINHVLYLTDVTVVKALLKSATQTEYNKIEAVIVGDTTELKAGDFKVTNTATNATVAVKSVSPKKDTADTFIIETFTGMTDAKEYSVEYAGTKTTFPATDGTVAKVGVNRTQIAAADKTEILMTTLDANGIILGYTPLNNSDSSKGNVTADVKFAKGYQDGSSLYLPTVGDTATVKVTYHTGTFGTDGKETGNIEDTFTITAVDPALINLSYAVTIGGSVATWTANSFKANTNVKYGDEVNAFFRITKEDGTDIGNYPDYKVTSADKTKLLVTETPLSGPATFGGSNAVKITGVSEGTTYILVMKDGKTVASLPVTVLGKPVATTLELNKASVTVVENASVSEIVSATIKDQYQDTMPIDEIKVTLLGKPGNLGASAHYKSVAVGADVSGDFGLNVTAGTVSLSGTTFSSTDDTGAYTFKISAKRNGVTLDRTLSVNVVKTATVQSYEVKIDKTEVDTTVSAAGYGVTDKDITIQVAEMANGGALDYYNNSDVEYTVKNAKGDVIAHVGNGLTSGVVTCSAINANITNNTLVVKPVTVNSSIYDKNLSAGTYYVTAKFTVSSKDVVVGGSFTIKDTQDEKVSFSIKNNNFGTNTIEAAFEGALDSNNNKFVVVYYDGLEQNVTSSDVIEVKGRALSSGGAFVKTVKLYVTVSGSTNKVPVTLNVNDQIASCADTTLAD